MPWSLALDAKTGDVVWEVEVATYQDGYAITGAPLSVKDMIITGGENVYSAEVENAVAHHPSVAQCAVIGIPSKEWGEAVHAIVVLFPGTDATEKEIIDVTREYIAGYKRPKSVTIRTEPLPLSGAMKVLKRELREPFWKDHDRNVG